MSNEAANTAQAKNTPITDSTHSKINSVNYDGTAWNGSRFWTFVVPGVVAGIALVARAFV